MMIAWTLVSRTLALIFFLGFAAPSVLAAYSCNVSVASVGILYRTGNADQVGMVTLNCSRDPALDGASMTYRIKAGDGQYFSGGRRVRLGATSNYLDYSLTRGSGAGVVATCTNNGNWSTTNGNSMPGTLAFTGSTASATWYFCARVRGNQGAPAAGVYTDLVGVYAEYGAAYALTTPTEALTYTVGVNNECVFNTQPGDLTLAYTSLSLTPQSATQTFGLLCSSGLPWSISIAPATGSLLGLNYSVNASPSSGTSASTTAPVTVTITATIPAGQGGTCPTATCSAAQTHVLTITY
jgi:spore coat protein U-like protein